MPKFKKLWVCLLILSLLFPSLASISLRASALPVSASLSVSARSALLMLGDGETVLYNKEANLRLPMASTTKIMTALVALEEASPDRMVTVDAAAIGTEGSSVYLVAGERLTLEQLLYALLLESANDAAVAIAIAVSGSVEAFAQRMNDTAERLGLSNTHFENPHGLDHEDHYTTALELAKITVAAMRHPLFRTIVSTRKTTIPHPDSETTRLLVNHNKLLRMYDGCIGVKTGYTQRSGRCLVSAAERDGVTLIAVTIDSPDDWEDHTRMLDYGFSRYTSRTLCTEGDLLHPLPLVGGTDAYVMLSNTDTVTVPLPRNVDSIVQRIECRRFEYATVREGDPCAAAVFLADTDGDGKREEIARVPLKALYTVEKKPVKKGFWAWLSSLFSRKKKE